MSKHFAYSRNLKKTQLLTSSWMAGGNAARNSGLTSVTPGPPNTGAVEDGKLVAAGGREGGLMPS